MSLRVAGDQLRPGASDVLRSVRISSGESPRTIGREYLRQETTGLHLHIHPSAGLPFHLDEVKDVHRPVCSRLHSDVTCGKGTVLYQLQKLYSVEFDMRRSLRTMDPKGQLIVWLFFDAVSAESSTYSELRDWEVWLFCYFKTLYQLS